MTSKERNEVEDHIIKTAGFDQTTKGYQAIKLLFNKNEWDFWLLLEPQLHQDLAIWLQQIGLKVEIRADKVNLTEDAIIHYYSSVMGLKAEPREQEKSYWERYNIIVKKD
ncbi:hypothetical protein CLU81_3577 [Flavobacterium sp. 9]|uniref:hypothetical protein n=1 Tax=Flavobacterium sp. 9 TaxID=2035198 RepID=UPI000C17A517|nr:hypothetical protein [Flavobacterium sp. 9]PIF33007.1 hypothetical protein CLU81_3577 [Flavobacterium sp. 9]